MIDLKPYYDAARAADEEVQTILNEMNVHFSAGTEEGRQAALDLRPALDEAKEKAAQANQLYLSMRDAAAQQGNSAAREFVPVTQDLHAGDTSAKEMARDTFDALDAFERLKFIRGGGRVVEPE